MSFVSTFLSRKTATQKELLDVIKDSPLSETDKKIWRGKVSTATKEQSDVLLVELQELLKTFEESDPKPAASSSASFRGSSAVDKPESSVLPASLSSVSGGTTALTTKAANTLMIQSLGFQVASDGSVMKRLDLVEFQSQVSKVVTKVNKEDIQRKLLSLSASQDSWSVISAFLTLPESVSLVALCAVSLVISPAERDVINVHLSTISILQGRTGRLQKSLVNLAGFIGLACAKDNTSVQRLVRFVPNPLLGEPARELQVRKLDTKLSKEENDVANKRQKEQYDQYVQIHKEITLTHASHFKELNDSIKGRVRKEMDTWFVTG